MAKTRIDLLRELAELQDLEGSDTEIVPPPIPEHEPPPPPPEPVLAPKKPRTEKQLAVFAKARETKAANALARKAEREAAEAAERAIIEEKLIKKALAIKRKQVKARALIDDLPEDTSTVLKSKVEKVEVVRESKKPDVPPPKPEPPKPVFHFF